MKLHVIDQWEPKYSRISAIVALVAVLTLRLLPPEQLSAAPGPLLYGLIAILTLSFCGLPITFIRIGLEEERKGLSIGGTLAAVGFSVYWAAAGIGQFPATPDLIRFIAFLFAIVAGSGYIVVGIGLRRLDVVFGRRTRAFGFVFLFFGVVMVTGRLLSPIFGDYFLPFVFLSDYILILVVIIAAIILFKEKDPPGLTPMRPLQ